MKLKVKIDEEVNVGHDLGSIDDYKVKIALPTTQPALVYKNENDTSPMTAKDFLNHVGKCGRKGVGIVVEENVSGSKAWLCDSDDLNDIKDADCSLEKSAGQVIIKGL